MATVPARTNQRSGAPSEHIDRHHIIRNSKGVEEAHSAAPCLWDVSGTEVDLCPSHHYVHGGHLWYLRERCFETLKAGRLIKARPMNAAARASGIAWTDDFRPEEDVLLEGIEGLDETPPRSAVIGPSGRVYSSKTFGLLEISHAPRRWAIKLVEWAPFDAFILVTILANCATMAWNSPLDPPGTLKALFIAACEWGYLLIFTFEMLAKICAYGFIAHDGAYLRDPWCQLDFAVVSLAWAPVFFPSFGNYSTLRALRALRALKRLHELKCTAYDASDGTHEQLLRRLWSCGFGSELKCELTSERWVHLGFQSADPTKDLRGMGLLGLANLVYFGEHYADVFQRLVSAQRKRDYPLACAGINITALLLELLNMKDKGEPQTVQSRPPFDGQWGSDMFFFFCHMFYRERAFEDMYCFCLRRLDRMMVAMDANYAEFNTVVAALRSRLVEALAQRPLSFREFKRLMAAASSESEGSVHSSSGCDSTAVPAGTTSTTSLFGGGGGLWATGSSRRSSCSAASSADDGGHEGEQGEHQLARTIAEAMSIIPRSLESLKAQLRGTHGRTAASAEGAPRSSVPAPRSEPAAAEAADERRARPPPLVELT